MPNTKRPAGPTLTPRAGLAAPSNGTAVHESTSPTVQPSIRRKVASYKIAETVWQDFAQYVKRLNINKSVGTETEIGMIAQQALVEYMHNHPVEG
jgi:hypothetical protein